MAHKHARLRARFNSDVGLLRGAIYKRALDRATEAYAGGFYLESIALIESLLADRLESIISVFDGTPAKFGTVNQGVAALRLRLAAVPGAADLPLFNALSSWGSDRARWIHEFAKVSTEGDLEWDERLEDARRVAQEGLELLACLTKEARAVVRAAPCVSA